MDTESWLEAELIRAIELLAEVKEKCANNQPGYDDVMLRAHENRVQGLKDTLTRLEIKG